MAAEILRELTDLINADPRTLDRLGVMALYVNEFEDGEIVPRKRLVGLPTRVVLTCHHVDGGQACISVAESLGRDVTNAVKETLHYQLEDGHYCGQRTASLIFANNYPEALALFEREYPNGNSGIINRR